MREGATEHSTLLNRFCGDKPSTQKTEGNALYLRYYSNLENPNIGFKAKVKIGKILLHRTLPVEVELYFWQRHVVALTTWA